VVFGASTLRWPLRLVNRPGGRVSRPARTGRLVLALAVSVGFDAGALASAQTPGVQYPDSLRTAIYRVSVEAVDWVKECR
jgi:hypothetical protein